MKKIDWDNLSIAYDKLNDRYVTKVTIVKGEPRKNIYGDSPEEVIKTVKSLVYQSGNQEYMIKKGIPLIELLRYNLSRRDKAGLIGDAQYARTQNVLKKIEEFDIANKNVKELKESDYQKFFEQLAKKYSQSSFDKFYSEVSQSLEFAYRKKIIEEIPLDKKFKPKCKKTTKEIQALTIEQQRILTKYLENATLQECSYKNAMLIQMYMGLRIGEVNALRIKEIDLKNKTILVHRTVTKDRNEKSIIEERTKTDAGFRTVPIPDNILPYIKEQMEIALNNKDKLLFLNRNKSFVTESSVNSQLKNRLVKLKIYEEGMATHALRHTYATRAIEAGIEPIVLSKLMGHSDIAVTLRKYVTIFNEFKSKSTEKTDKYYNDLDLFNKKVSLEENEKEQKIAKNNRNHSNIIQFPRRFVANDNFER